MIYLLAPLAFIPQWATHILGRLLGRLCYIAIPRWRKRALSNLALARSLKLSNRQIVQIAKRSFENLGIVALEYPKLYFRKGFLPVTCENPEVAKEKGVIFFCGHQANWELLFLEGTSRMAGVAIGRPIKQKKLYGSILKLREKYGGTIIPPKLAIKEGLRALREGKFLGIVGDQGMPESPYCSEFLGRRAYTTTAPALLALKTKAPLIVANIARKGLGYTIRYSDPIPLSGSASDVMDSVLKEFEKGVLKRPEEWLWVHNRFKQETPAKVYYKFRHDAILIVADRPDESIKVFRTIYPRAFITLLTPSPFEWEGVEVIRVSNQQEYRLNDYRFKLVFNLTSAPLSRHFKRQSALAVYTKKDLETFAECSGPIDEIAPKALCRR